MKTRFTTRQLLSASACVAAAGLMMPASASANLIPPGYIITDLGDGGATGDDMRENRVGGFAGGTQPYWNMTRGLNDNGQVAGEIFTQEDVTSLYTGSFTGALTAADDAAANGDVQEIENQTGTNINTINRDWAAARDVNNSGIVAGTTRIDSGVTFISTAIEGDRAFRYDPSTDTFTLLSSSGGSFPTTSASAGMDINDSGRVFGGGAPNGANFRPGFWDGTTWTEATQAGNLRLTQGLILGGNNNGEGVGMGVRNGAGAGGGQQAFVVDAAGTVTFLDQNVNVTLVGDSVAFNPNARAQDLNDAGVLVGGSTGVGGTIWPGNAGADVPAMWVPTGGGNYDMIVMPQFTSEDGNLTLSGIALAINEAGLAVGVTASTTTGIRGETLGGERDTWEYFNSTNMAGGGFGNADYSAFLWDTVNNVAVDIESVVVGLDPTWNILAATDINENNEVTVLYTTQLSNDGAINDDIRSAVLTVIPEPGTLMLLVPALGLVAGRRQRKA